MLRGRHNVRVDEKGRIKLPAPFKTYVESNFDRKFFVTSLTGKSVLLYPMKCWEELEAKLSEKPSMSPEKKIFLDFTNYYGQVVEMDSQGRLVIPAELRESAELVGEAIVMGYLKYMEIWLHEKFLKKLKENPFTEDHGQALSVLGV